MSQDTWTPPPSRLTGNGFGMDRRDLTPRPPSRFPALGAAPDAGGTPAAPPSRLNGYSFGAATPAATPTAGPRRRLPLILLALFTVLSLGAGTFMVIEGARPVVQDAPLPDKPDYIAPADQQPVGPDGVEPPAAQTPTAPGDTPKAVNSGAVAVENADTGGGEAGWSNPRSTVPVTMMSTALMEPMSVFVPEAKMYSLARPSDTFVRSKYAGMESITIPDNPHRTVWYSGGGTLATTNANGTPAASGTTFLGSHSGYAGLWGAYVHMAQLKGGETVWTKDAKGQLQRWQVDRIRYMPHTSFPQEYWTSQGPRRLVMTTCGGTVGSDGIYNQNVFIEAKPVKTDGSVL